MASRSRRPASAPKSLPTDAEFDILSVLWRSGPMTVREVHELLGKDIGYTTTLKQMQVLTEKGLLKRSERYRSHVYEPSATKEQIQSQIAADMLHRAFDGSAKNLMLGALNAQPASRDELKDIRRMLDEYEKRQSGK